jgi:hypothetical protein
MQGRSIRRICIQLLSIGFKNLSLYVAVRVYTRSAPGRERVILVTMRQVVCVSCYNAATSKL